MLYAWGDLMRNSYIIFVFVMLILLLRLSVIRNKELRMTEIYKEQARTDALTGFLNKGAYITREVELTSKLLNSRHDAEKKSL